MTLTDPMNILGFGNFGAPLMVVILLVITNDLDVVWRLALALGAVPGLIMLPFRIAMHETASFKKHHKPEKAASFSDRVWRRASLIGKHWRNIVGTAGNWFVILPSSYTIYISRREGLNKPLSLSLSLFFLALAHL